MPDSNKFCSPQSLSQRTLRLTEDNHSSCRFFFPTLKKLATDPQYTYNNFVTTDDVEQLFSKAAGKNLKALFDFYLRTTKKLEFTILQTGFHEYSIKATNLPMPLPIDVLTDTGTQQIMLGDKSIKITSNFPPVLDANGHYLKKVGIN